MCYKYKASGYARVVQRFTFPIFEKALDGSFSLSSTATCLTYEGQDYFILAAHALVSKNENNENNDLKNLFCWHIGGGSIELSEFVESYKVFRKDDIVICRGKIFSDKLSFNLSLGDEAKEDFFKEQEKVCMAWLGFPVNKAEAKIIHRTKSDNPERLKECYIHDNELHTVNSMAIFRLITLENRDSLNVASGDTSDIVEAKFDNQDKLALNGMSGGPMFYMPTKRLNALALRSQIEHCVDPNFEFKHVYSNLNLFIHFSGIGLEYSKKNKVVRGCSKKRIIELLEQFEDISKN